MCERTQLGRGQFHTVFRRYVGTSQGNMWRLCVYEAQRMLLDESDVLSVALDVDMAAYAFLPSVSAYHRKLSAAWARKHGGQGV